MPVITVQTWEGKSPDQKRKLVAAITSAMIEHFDSNVEKTFVIIQDVPKDSWGHAGVLSIDDQPRA